MGRPATKSDLISAAEANFKEMNELIDSLTETELSTPFSFDATKKEAHWQRDKNLRDVLTHLYEWHQLLLDWVPSNMNGEAKPFLPRPYNWKTYGKMNEFFWEKHQCTTLEEARVMLERSHREVMALMKNCFQKEFINGWAPVLSAPISSPVLPVIITGP